ncbi:hypothetical protein SSP24_00900 [Streptomyces spinoverrucosus]|uniref:PknH-like extracellular domain-containing protein n=1 Tax=Streptomyces spinoverrucosus TaxID=284043 RepID=A0A4Y3V7L5_9ACTN|nr:hypothetical protein [Streptomyces spinoverrucosus]GEC02435.1 hypothetical protein SSP24_00900 [Streptomyces spinoverrucosus]GHB43003.1 hypothetical protein GCM10010397_11690 [Streptomyces spinoverrucosus]
MNVRARLGIAALTVGAAVALTAVPAAAGPAASGTPRFLAPGQLPPHPTSSWYAGPVTAGQPDPLPICVGEALPSIATHRTYWTEFDTNALQVTVVERNERRAKEFAALLRKELADCAENLMEQYPDVTAAEKYYGRLNVEEGAHVYGIHTVWEWGASDIALFSVGRDGRTVTVVKWAQMGTFEHAQVADFKATTVKAVNKLY